MGRNLGVPVVMNRLSPAPFADFRLCDGEILRVGNMRLKALATPGHTRDSMCFLAEDRIFTGDTLLIGGTGRTDLPTGDPEALHDSLFNVVLKLDPALGRCIRRMTIGRRAIHHCCRDCRQSACRNASAANSSP